MVDPLLWNAVLEMCQNDPLRSCCLYTHSIDAETEVQGGYVSQPQSHGRAVQSQGENFRSQVPEPSLNPSPKAPMNSEKQRDHHGEA